MAWNQSPMVKNCRRRLAKCLISFKLQEQRLNIDILWGEYLFWKAAIAWRNAKTEVGRNNKLFRTYLKLDYIYTQSLGFFKKLFQGEGSKNRFKWLERKDQFTDLLRKRYSWPSSASMEGKSLQLESPVESVTQFFHRLDQKVEVVMTDPSLDDTFQ